MLLIPAANVSLPKFAGLFLTHRPVILALILECFRAMSFIPLHLLASTLANMTSGPDSKSNGNSRKSHRTHKHPVQQISHLLSAVSATSQYLFLSCLNLLDASLWAGMESNVSGISIPAQLDKWEVGRIMSFMASEDENIRILVSI